MERKTKFVICSALMAGAMLAGRAANAASVTLNFNTGSTDSFSTNFAQNNANGTGSTGTTFAYSSTGGISDQAGSAGGGVTSGANPDETAIYTPTQFNVTDGTTATITEYVKFTAAAGGNKPLQLGFVNAGSQNGTFFNTATGINFISVRILNAATPTAEVQTESNGNVTSAQLTSTFGTSYTSGDWVQAILTVAATGSANSYAVSYTFNDLGANGTSAPTSIASNSGTINTNTPAYSAFTSSFAGWRNSAGAGTTANYDNFTVTATAATPEPASFALLGLGVLGLLARRRRA